MSVRRQGLKESIGRIVLAGVLLAVPSQVAFAGDWQPDPTRRYSLELGEGSAEPLTDGDRAWARSLVINLQRRGGTVTESELFPLYSNGRLLLNGSPAPHRVYEVEAGVRYLAMHSGSSTFLVDFERKSVYLAAGPSLHPHPSSRFVVAVYSHRPVLAGIPVVGPGVDLRFEKRVVSWQ